MPRGGCGRAGRNMPPARPCRSRLHLASPSSISQASRLLARRHTSHTDTHAARHSATWVPSAVPVSWDTCKEQDLSNTRCDVQELQPESTSLGPAQESLCVWSANLTSPLLPGSPTFGTVLLSKSPKPSTQLHGWEGAQLCTEQKKIYP